VSVKAQDAAFCGVLMANYSLVCVDCAFKLNVDKGLSGGPTTRERPHEQIRVQQSHDSPPIVLYGPKFKQVRILY
jgi:hypothetical protein